MSASLRRREGGFSLVLVLVLMTMMIGIAATVGLTTQLTAPQADRDRDAIVALYAAEYGVALAEDRLLSDRPVPECVAAGEPAAAVALDGATASFCFRVRAAGGAHLTDIEAYGLTTGGARAHVTVTVDRQRDVLTVLAWRER